MSVSMNSSISLNNSSAASSGFYCPTSSSYGPTLETACYASSSIVNLLAMLDLYIRSQCDINDPHGRIKAKEEPRKEYDFIVVGGGSAGSVVASRLSEIPHWNVLLLEAGPDEPAGTQIPSFFLSYFGSSIDWNYKTVPQKRACLAENGHKCTWPRGKVLGGTSVINGMMYLRGNPEDYDDWARMGNRGWRYKDVLPYFLKSEDNVEIDQMDQGYHAAGGLLRVAPFPYNPPMSYSILKAAEKLGYKVQDLNGRNTTGFMRTQTHNLDGVRISMARAFLRPARNRTNLDIVLNTMVTKVIIDQKTKTATGVEIFNPQTNERYKVNARKEVIVSGGTINSPQLLMLSGIGAKSELHKVGIKPIVDLKGVGKNLHNHVAYYLNYQIRNDTSTDLNEQTVNEYKNGRSGLLSGTGISDITGKGCTKYARPGVPDVQFFFGGYDAACPKQGVVGTKNNIRTIEICPTLTNVHSRGYLTLASNNPFDHPIIQPNYLKDKRDAKALIEAIKMGRKLFEQDPIKNDFGVELWIDEEYNPCKSHSIDSDEFWLCAIQIKTHPENHMVGTCKMGSPIDSLAVVDRKLKVYGVNGLRVIDASVMPKVTAGNTNAPIVMIAERGSEFIRHEWSRKF